MSSYGRARNQSGLQLNLKINTSGPQDLAQSTKCLPREHEDLSSWPQKPHKTWVWWHQPVTLAHKKRENGGGGGKTDRFREVVGQLVYPVDKPWVQWGKTAWKNQTGERRYPVERKRYQSHLRPSNILCKHEYIHIYIQMKSKQKANPFKIKPKIPWLTQTPSVPQVSLDRIRLWLRLSERQTHEISSVPYFLLSILYF